MSWERDGFLGTLECDYSRGRCRERVSGTDIADARDKALRRSWVVNHGKEGPDYCPDHRWEGDSAAVTDGGGMSCRGASDFLVALRSFEKELRELRYIVKDTVTEAEKAVLNSLGMTLGSFGAFFATTARRAAEREDARRDQANADAEDPVKPDASSQEEEAR